MKNGCPLKNINAKKMINATNRNFFQTTIPISCPYRIPVSCTFLVHTVNAGV